jgi:hypothetical protein
MSLSLALRVLTAPSLHRYLDTNGDGTGTKIATGNYASPTDFFIKPPANQIFLIDNVVTMIEDDLPISAEKYGGLAALTNGITIAKKDSGGIVTDMSDGKPIKSNADWGVNCSLEISTFGAGNNFVKSGWDFTKLGYTQILDGRLGHFLAYTLNDDFSGLVNQCFKAGGRVITL